MYFRMLAFAVTTSCILACALIGGEPDSKGIQGRWSISYAFLHGKTAKPEELEKGEVEISAGKLAFRAKGSKKDANAWFFKINPNVKPKTIDFNTTRLRLTPEGDGVEKIEERFLAIFDLKDDQLRIACSAAVPVKKDPKEQAEADKSATRPTNFEHGPSVHGVLILKRIKK